MIHSILKTIRSFFIKVSFRTIPPYAAILAAAFFPAYALAGNEIMHGGTHVSDGSSVLVTHPVPQGIYYAMHNDDFTVQVRLPGGKWQDLYEYKVKVNMDSPTEASMVYFDFEGKVEIMVKKNDGIVRSAEIRPLSRGIRSRLKDNILTFTLDRPQNISVEFDGDRRRNLHIFTNPPEKSAPSPDEDGVMYFGGGVHTPAEGEDGFRIPSDTHVYLAPGSVVKGTLICDSVKNVTVSGRGLLVTPQRGIQATYSENITVEDIIVVNPRHYTFLGGQSRGISIRNLRSFSYQGWSDGIDVMSSSDILVDNVFMRNSDDCIAVYGPRWDYRGDTRNITVQNSVLWADIAHPMNMGIHGYTGDGKGSVIENITFRNIDVLEHDEDDPEYRGCMAICCGDMNHIRNILYEDIRVERIEEGQLFHVEVVYNSKYCSAPGNSVSGVIFRNISCPYIPDLKPSSLKGYDADRTVNDVVFDNVRIGGRRMKSLDGTDTNEFIHDITFE